MCWKNYNNMIVQQSEVNQNIANFTKNIKHVPIEDETNNEDEKTSTLVVLRISSDSDSIFGLPSQASRKKI